MDGEEEEKERKGRDNKGYEDDSMREMDYEEANMKNGGWCYEEKNVRREKMRDEESRI